MIRGGQWKCGVQEATEQNVLGREWTTVLNAAARSATVET